MDAFAHGEERNWTSNVYHLGTDLQSAATPPIVAASPKCADTSLHISVCDCATHTVSDQLGTIGTDGFEPPTFHLKMSWISTRLKAPANELRSKTAIRRLAIFFIVPCVALSCAPSQEIGGWGFVPHITTTYSQRVTPLQVPSFPY